MFESNSYSSFSGTQLIASGSLIQNALAVKHALVGKDLLPVLIFDDTTGRTIDLDLRGSDDEIAKRLSGHGNADKNIADAATDPVEEPRGRGRPKLGVVAREVTLLPRHWEWLAKQPGGASVVLRRLVEEARRDGADNDKKRAAQERAYHFMSVIAGNLPGFEEATRALFANDEARFKTLIEAWPIDVREHAIRLAF